MPFFLPSQPRLFTSLPLSSRHRSLSLSLSIMAKQPKQQLLSRFFSPSTSPSSPPSKPSPKISSIISYSPSKRLLSSLPLSPSKKPKLQLNDCTSSKSKLDSPPKNDTSSSSGYTPLEQQVVELKQKYPGVILMVEVGYRYRFFGEDADVAAKILGIIAHLDRSFVTASVPTFRLDFHVRRLVAAGYKVGVVKQTETAAIKSQGSNKLGPFVRSLSSLYTKATLQSHQSTETSEAVTSNYILCIVEKQIAGKKHEVRIGVLAVEVSTGFVMHGEFDDVGVRSALEAILLSFGPVEILIGGPVSDATEKLISSYAGPQSEVRIERKSRDCFKEGGALAEIMSLYENNNYNNTSYCVINNDYNDEIMEGKENDGNCLGGIERIMELPELVIQALALIIRYLKEFGLERIICFGSSFKPISNNFEMSLSANTLHQLEVLKNNSDGSSEGSLFQAMNNTFTSFGSRLLKQWLIRPLCDINLITARLDAVSEILESMDKFGKSFPGNSETGNSNPDLYSVLCSVLTVLGKSVDVERGITRIFHRSAKPNEFIGIIQAILTASKELEKLNNDQNTPVNSSLLRRLICTASSNSVISRAVKLLSCLNKDSAENNSTNDISDLFVLSDDKFPEVATGKINVEIAKEKLNSLIFQYRRQLKMNNLEFKTISGISHLIELDSNVKVPSTWSKISSTKKCTRYHPPEIVRALNNLNLSKEKFQLVCIKTWNEFLSGFEQHYTVFKVVLDSLASLDCLVSLANIAKDKNYVRPVFCKEGEPREINIKTGRHPVLESILGDNFVPNDTNLNSEGEFCQIVTGPNMGGKSCYIRQVALISLMAQVGSFVPASSAKLHVIDKILTRMGASECMQKGRSTFFDELSETSQIMQSCTASSLVIIDELGRGTSTHDGTAIAYETLKYLIRVKKCMVVFVTHYPKILDLVKELDGQVGAFRVSFVTNNNTSTNNNNNNEFCEDMDVTFLYKVVRGASDKSFGLNVARLAQLPSKCIARAANMAGKLEEELIERKNEEGRNDKIISENAKCEIISNINISEEIFRDFLLKLRLAFREVHESETLGYLKEARELALSVINGC